MQNFDPDFMSILSAYLFCGGCILGFIWMGWLYYLKMKWLLILEDQFDDGVRFYSLNLFLAGQGVLQCATIFLSSFHAKCYGMLEKKDQVPKYVQKLFIFSFIWFMTVVALMVSEGIITEVYIKPERI
jgi:sulfoxide reductase heme-binding subunit YedZ